MRQDFIYNEYMKQVALAMSIAGAIISYIGISTYVGYRLGNILAGILVGFGLAILFLVSLIMKSK